MMYMCIYMHVSIYVHVDVRGHHMSSATLIFETGSPTESEAASASSEFRELPVSTPQY